MLETPTPNHPSPSKDELKLQISVLKQEVQTHTEVVTTLVRQNDQEITDHKAALKAQSYQKRGCGAFETMMIRQHGLAVSAVEVPERPKDIQT